MTADWHNELAGLKSNLARVESVLTRLANVEAQFATLRTASEAEKRDLLTQVSGLQDELRVQQETVRRLNEKMSRDQAQAVAAQATLQGQIAPLNADLAHLRQGLADAQSQWAISLEAAKKERDQARNDHLTARTRWTTELEKVRQTATAEVNVYKSQLATAQAQVASEREKAQRAAAELVRDRKAHEEAVDALRVQLGNTKSALEIERNQMAIRALGDQEAITASNNRAVALQNSAESWRLKADKATTLATASAKRITDLTGQLAAEKASRLADRQAAEEREARLLRQIEDLKVQGIGLQRQIAAQVPGRNS